MTYGGTNWGWLADPRQVYTSYDYGAPISEPRQTGADYDEMKRQGLFYTTTAPLTATDPADAPASSNDAVHIEARANPDTHTQFLYLRHGDPMADADATTTFDWKTPDGTYPVTATAQRQDRQDPRRRPRPRRRPAARLLHQRAADQREDR